MNDCMAFPDTVEEFMEQYKIIDTEQVYTNGTELVPIFRMKQWFEHLPTVQPDLSEEDIRLIKQMRSYYNGTYAKAIDHLMAKASAQPEQKKGKWIQISPARIYECSECGQNVMTDDIDAYKWCHGCGADMRGEQDDK